MLRGRGRGRGRQSHVSYEGENTCTGGKPEETSSEGYLGRRM